MSESTKKTGFLRNIFGNKRDKTTPERRNRPTIGPDEHPTAEVVVPKKDNKEKDNSTAQWGGHSLEAIKETIASATDDGLKIDRKLQNLLKKRNQWQENDDVSSFTR